MPIESDEVRELKKWTSVSGVYMRITSTNGGSHAPTSYHYAQGTNGVGLAVDLAAASPGSDTPGLLAIYNRCLELVPKSHELFYSGPGGGFWKNGARFFPATDSTIFKNHHNHIHLAVRLGFKSGVVTVPDDPNLPNIKGPIAFFPIVDSAGKCTGYYYLSLSTGELHGHGPGAQYYGRSEVIA